MNYSDLDLNARINLKGTYEQYLKISIEKFRVEQDKKLYRTRNRGKRKLTRTHNLYNSFGRELQMSSSGLDVLKINFSLYGRFIDMGVGRGVNMNAAQLRKRYNIHKPDVPRKPIKWYSKRKTSEEKRLSEILAQRYGLGLMQMAETLLSNTVTLNLQ